jgi:prolyl oligopeptidase
MHFCFALLMSACGAVIALGASDAPPGPVPPAPVASGAISYPPTRLGTVTDTFHGVVVADPYRWMEDLRSPEVAAFIDAQNRLSIPRLQADAAYKAARARIAALEDVYPTQEPGIEVGGRTFFRALVNGTVGLNMQEDGGSGVSLLLDGSSLGKDASLKAFVPSPDARHVAYVVAPAGTDWGEIRIRDIAAGQDLPVVLPHVRFEGPLAWTADGAGLIYRRFSPPRGGRREVVAEGAALYLHRLGTPWADDMGLFPLPEDRRDWSLSFGLPGDRHQLFIYVERGPWADGSI